MRLTRKTIHLAPADAVRRSDGKVEVYCGQMRTPIPESKGRGPLCAMCHAGSLLDYDQRLAQSINLAFDEFMREVKQYVRDSQPRRWWQR